MSSWFNRSLGNVRYVSAECSTGKTLAACKYIVSNLGFNNLLYVAPTKRLLHQTQAALQELGVNPTLIDSDTNPKMVTAAIIKYLKEAPDCGAVLLVTWNAYENLAYFHRPENWARIIDEVPQLDAFYPFKLPRNHHFLTANIEILRTVNEQIVEVGPKHPGALKRLLEKPHDDIDDHFRPLFQALLSKHKTVHLDIDSWTRIAEKQIISEQDEKNRIYFLVMLKPSLFQNSILLGANVEQSMLYDWLIRLHRKAFIREEAIYSDLRSLPANLAERLTINHFGFAKLFSKYQAGQAGDDGRAVLDRMTDVAIETFAGDPFLFTLNKDRDDKRLVAAGGTRIPAIAHGLNEYQTYCNVFFAAALNREPKHNKMLVDLGFTSKRIQQSALEVAYQGTMRSALRDFDSDAKVRVIVPDLPSVRYLIEAIGSCRVEQIGDLAPPTRLPPLTQTQKAQRKRALEHQKKLLPPKSIPDSLIVDSGIYFGGSGLDGADGSRCLVTFHNSPFDERPDQFLVQPLGYQEFIQIMRASAKALVFKKEDQYLFNGTVFKPPEGSTGYRRQDYFHRSCCMVLDFDDGKLTPEQFIDIFWKKAGAAQKRSFFICNSYSRSAETPNRFRVILLYRRPAMSLEQHRTVYDAIVGRIAEVGYSEEAAGLDRNCRSGVQSFYMPGTNRHHQDWGFFKTRGTKTRELAQYGIDPIMYWKTANVKEQMTNGHSNLNGAMATAAIEELTLAIKAMPEGRHKLFFKLATRLALHYGDEAKVRCHLLEVAGSDKILQMKVPGAIASLLNYRIL